MAMFGTFVLEDLALTYRVTMPDSESPLVVTYTVVNNFNGEEETVVCSSDAWEAALILHALGSEAKFSIDYEAVELAAKDALPKNPELRWYP